MRTLLGTVAAVVLAGGMTMAAAWQAGDEPVTVSSEHPRLLLRPGRLRLLKRERERASQRWQQFEALIAGRAPMPERGFALALYYAVAGAAPEGRQAVAWALGRESDLRQQALVYDWCQELLGESQRKELEARLEKGITAPPADDSVATTRSRALAAVALFDHSPTAPRRELERIVRTWWEGKLAPALREGRGVIQRDDAYPLYELLHAMRDNTNIDLRESCPGFFRQFPIEHLMSYYPAFYEGPDSEYYIGATQRVGEPDLRAAALSRAADLAMVAFDTNAAPSQVLQGWLMHDRFMLRGTFGAPYEFLWANPYQPGLSYYHVPLVYYNAEFGTLFVRSTWEPTARWFGLFGGTMQLFEEGHVAPVDPRRAADPIVLKEAIVCVARTAKRFRVRLEENEPVYVVGLEPRKPYQVEIDDEELYEAVADLGGIIELEVPRGKEVGIRLQ